jgi:hypothetical protein
LMMLYQLQWSSTISGNQEFCRLVIWWCCISCSAYQRFLVGRNSTGWLFDGAVSLAVVIGDFRKAGILQRIVLTWCIKAY